MTNLKRIRMADPRELPQRILADLSGVSIHTIRSYEQGKRRPKIENALKLAKVLGCKPGELMG